MDRLLIRSELMLRYLLCVDHLRSGSSIDLSAVALGWDKSCL